MPTGVMAVCYATHRVRRNGCQGFFFVFLAATNRCTLNVEVANPAGETEICACEIQSVIAVQLLYCVKVYLILNKITYKFSLICNNTPSKFFAVLLTHRFRTAGLKQYGPEFEVYFETALLISQSLGPS